MPATRHKTVTYTSFRAADPFRGPRPRELRLVRYPGPDLRDNAGALSGMGEELVYTFEGGMLRVDEALLRRDRQYIAERAERLHLDPSDEVGTVEWLEQHELFGLEFFKQEEQAPDPVIALSEITMAVVAGDLERLVELHEEEDSTWGRDEVLGPCRAAIEKLEAAESRPDGPEADHDLLPHEEGPKGSGGLSGAPAGPVAAE